MTPLLAAALLQVSPAALLPPDTDLPAMTAQAVFSTCIPVITGELTPSDPSAFGSQPAEEIERQRLGFYPDDRQVFRYTAGGAYVGLSYQPAFSICSVITYRQARATHDAVQAGLAAEGWRPLPEAPEDDYAKWWEKPGTPLVMQVLFSASDPDGTGLNVEVMDRTRGVGADNVQSFIYRRRPMAEALVSAVVEVCPLTFDGVEPTAEQQAFLERSTVWNEAYQAHSATGEVFLMTDGRSCLATASGPDLSGAEAALRRAVAGTDLIVTITHRASGLSVAVERAQSPVAIRPPLSVDKPNP